MNINEDLKILETRKKTHTITDIRTKPALKYFAVS